MSGVVRWRRKPDQPESEPNVAVRWEPGVTQLADVLEVARLADHKAQVVVAAFGTGPVLVVRYTKIWDEYPASAEYETIEPGQWLAYSHEHGFLYDSNDADWAQFYDRVS